MIYCIPIRYDRLLQEAVRHRLLMLGYTPEASTSVSNALEGGFSVNSESGTFHFFSADSVNRIECGELSAYGIVILNDLFYTEKYKSKSLSVVLNDTYRAILRNGKVEVGCTSFPLDTIDRLAEAKVKYESL